MRVRITRFDEYLTNLSYTGFLDVTDEGVALTQTFPYTFYMGPMTHRGFIEQILWVRANCSGQVTHNYNIRLMRNAARRGERWHTVIGFSDLNSAALFKTVWGHPSSVVGYG